MASTAAATSSSDVRSHLMKVAPVTAPAETGPASSSTSTT